MLGDHKVIEELNTALSSELTAIVQYVAQSEMCQG
jgi:bacterioferritin (cytochrome b1)